MLKDKFVLLFLLLLDKLICVNYYKTDNCLLFTKIKILSLLHSVRYFFPFLKREEYTFLKTNICKESQLTFIDFSSATFTLQQGSYIIKPSG